jgi:hypothetical protein
MRLLFVVGLVVSALSFQSNTHGAGVDEMMYVPPLRVFEADGLELFKERFENLGQGKSIYHLRVAEQAYKLHLNGKTACLEVSSAETIVEHADLIEAWVETFKDQPISRFLVTRSE